MLILTAMLMAGIGLGWVGFLLGERGGAARQRLMDEKDQQAAKHRFIEEKAFRRAVQIELNQLRQENQKFLNLFVSVPDAVKRLHVHQTIEEAIGSIVRLTKDIINPNEIAFFLYLPETSQLELKLAYNPPPGLPPNYQVRVGEGPIGLTAERRLMMSEEDFAKILPHLERSKCLLHPSLCSPLLFEEELVGVLSIGRTGDEAGREKLLLAMISDIAAIQVQAAKRQLITEKEAITDPLTGLYNRRYFFTRLPDELKRAKNYQFSCSVFLFDIDHFKHYNDTQGHPAGDRLLESLSLLVNKNTRRTDILARYGGEEFVVLLTNTDKEAAYLYAEKVRNAIASALFPHAESQPLGRITVSGGVATFPDDAETADLLIKCADQALYQAKQAGRNRIVRFGL